MTFEEWWKANYFGTEYAYPFVKRACESAFNAGIEAAAEQFKGQYTDTNPQVNISMSIMRLKEKSK